MAKILLIAGFVVALWMLGFAASNAGTPVASNQLAISSQH